MYTDSLCTWNTHTFKHCIYIYIQTYTQFEYFKNKAYKWLLLGDVVSERISDGVSGGYVKSHILICFMG